MKYVDSHLRQIEAGMGISTDRRQVLSSLRALGLNDFSSVLWSMPDERFPKLSHILPQMASEDVQRSWTGYVGQVLLSQSISFMRAMAANYTEITGQSLRDKRILDFGCGYGRLLRLSAFYSESVFGVDPWTESINHCNSLGLESVFLSDYLPTTLPVPTNFEFAYAFSVFTHLSERATMSALTALHRHMVTGGILCITIRLVEFWRMAFPDESEEVLSEFEERHNAGFCFLPHNRDAVDGDVTYGDTTMTLEWLNKRCNLLGWKIEATDRTIDDPTQRFVFLRKL